MTLIAYIDNEVPNFGEWDAVAAGGDSTIAQCPEAAFDERGTLGLRFQTGWDSAYVRKDMDGDRSDLAVGFWMRIEQSPSWAWGATEVDIFRALTAGGAMSMSLRLCSYGDSQRLELRQNTDGGEIMASDGLALGAGRWYYVAAVAHWGEGECTGRLYVDGALRNQCASPYGGTGRRPAQIRLGFMRDDYVCTAVVDFDEVKLADDYPEPFHGTPAAETPEPARTIVLFNQADPNSISFADYCAEHLSVPRGNLCPLPNASAAETLSDYASFQTQVENDLKDWLARNGSADGQCTCMLVGPAVPGCFMDGGVSRSATSRLMNLKGTFTPGCVNPLYKPVAVARLTKADLAGLYLVTRIDADQPSRARQLVDRAETIGSLDRLEADNMLYCDDAGYRSSVSCGRLRLPTADIATLESDAFAWGCMDDPQFGTPGRRVAFVGTSAASADTLRSTGSPCSDALLEAGYAAAVGNSDDAEDFDPECFFEMLRIGGTFAEAVAVATARLDYTSVAVGVPTLTVGFPRAGVNVYHGAGAADTIDYSAPVACLREGQTTADVPIELADGQEHYLAARAVSEDGVEETNTSIIACASADAAGALLAAPLPAVHDVTVDVSGPSSVLVGFSCSPRDGQDEPSAFEILSDNGSGVPDTENPVKTVTARPRRHDYSVLVTDIPLPAKLAVRAIDGGRTGPVSRAVTADCPTAAIPTLL
ncbi:MAG: LamG-like jellyroll fold domain-containing protein [Phycisphaerae bacterium]